MKSWQTKSGYQIVQVLSNRSNSYLISANQINILVDSGKLKVYNRLRKNINSLSSEKQRIDYLFLTHTHYDHCQNAQRLKQEKHCKIIVGSGEAAFCNTGYTPVPNGTFMFTRFMVAVGKKYLKHRLSYTPFEVDIAINRSFDFINHGLNIEIISSPGHSAGSACIIVDNEIALVGDTLFGIFPRSVFPPFADDLSEMVKSWEKLLQTDCRIFLPGHGNPISRELLQKEFIKYSN